MQRCYHCMEETFRDGRCYHCGKTTPSERTRAYSLPPGAQLQHGRYIVGNVLGGGGFGLTYIALDTTDNHKVAIKEFFPNTLSSRSRNGTTVECSDNAKFTDIMRAFHREARTMQRLSGHNGIVRFEQSFEENRTAYIVMELLEGHVLRDVVRESGKMSFSVALGYIVPATDALAYVHQCRVLHRDISPDNIYVCNDSSIRLIDFGASYVDAEEFTQTHPGIKKRGYSPPEQNASEERQGPWMDVYSMTACLYYCLAGKNPEDFTERLYQEDPMDKEIKRLSGLTSSQREILRQGLSIRYAQRYQSGKELLDKLKAEQHEKKEPISQPPKKEPRKMTQTKHKTATNGGGAKPTPLKEPQKAPPKVPEKGWWRGGAVGKLVRSTWVEYMLILLLCRMMYPSSDALFAMLAMAVIDTFALMASHDATPCMMARGMSYTSEKGTRITFLQALGNSLCTAFVPMVVVETIIAARKKDDRLWHHHALQLELHAQQAGKQQQQKVTPTSQRSETKLCLVCTNGTMQGQTIWLEEPNVCLGRDPKRCNITITQDGRVSGLHCQIARNGDEYWLADLRSSNGTFLNGERIECPRKLKQGDTVKIGNEQFVVNEYIAKE